MQEPRDRYFKQLRKQRRGARRWSVLAGMLGGATVVLTPYAGIALVDALWAAAAGGAGVLALWRWTDVRELVRRGAPPALDPAVRDQLERQRLASAVERLPFGRLAIEQVRRQKTRVQLRGTAAADAYRRLDEAAATLNALSPRLGPASREALDEAIIAERHLRDLAQRVVAVERSSKFAPADARGSLGEAGGELARQLVEGVAAYERLVAAAAEWVAEDSRTPSLSPPVERLTDAADKLRGLALGLGEIRGMKEMRGLP